MVPLMPRSLPPALRVRKPDKSRTVIWGATPYLFAMRKRRVAVGDAIIRAASAQQGYHRLFFRATVGRWMEVPNDAMPE